MAQKQQTLFHQGNIERMVLNMMSDSNVELPDLEVLSVGDLKRLYLKSASPGKQGIISTESVASCNDN